MSLSASKSAMIHDSWPMYGLSKILTFIRIYQNFLSQPNISSSIFELEWGQFDYPIHYRGADFPSVGANQFILKGKPGNISILPPFTHALALRRLRAGYKKAGIFLHFLSCSSVAGKIFLGKGKNIFPDKIETADLKMQNFFMVLLPLTE